MMLNLWKAKEKLKEHQEAQEYLVTQSQNILRGQADVLCQALQQLKRRSAAGQETAELIWNSLIDGITAEIPDKFFHKYSRNYFWKTSEQLSNDELAFRKLLEQVASKKNTSQKEKFNGEESKSRNSTGYETGPDTEKIVPIPTTSSKICVNGEKKDADEDDELLGHLVAILKVSAAMTSPVLWEWRREDDTLREEVRMFNESLKGAMDLFTEIHSSPDLTCLIESLEKVSLLETKITSRISHDKPSEFIGGEEQNSDDDGGGEVKPADSKREVFDKKIATELDFKQTRSIDVTTKTTQTDNVVNQVLTVKHHPLPSDLISGKANTSKLDTDGEEYIIRHARSKLAGHSLTTNPFESGKCDHAGYKLPMTHYRDWRRDGFRCMCGQKFRLLNSMDRHIFTQQMVRMLACDQCDYKINRKCCMDRHKRDNHNKPKMLRACRRLYQCMFGCDGILKSKADLLEHQNTTQRQCKYINAMKLPLRQLPSSEMNFLEVLKNTLDRSNVLLTKTRLTAILAAAEKDANRLKKTDDNNEEI